MFDSKRRAELDAAIELIHFSYRELTLRPDHVLAARGLARAHHRILYFVAKLRAPSVSELLQALAVSKQALAGPLRDLYAQQLIRYERGVPDARVKRLALTEAGKKLEGRLAAQQRQAFAAAFAAAGTVAESGWHDVMRRLAADAMRRAGRPPPGGGSVADGA
jgi:DNA-binding MarR family transcriptional regulator